MKLYIYVKCALLALITILTTGCKSDSPEPDAPVDTRTVLVYMVANNNLSPNSYDDLQEMKQGASQISNGSLMVYHHPADNSPRLLEISPDGRERVIKTYSTDESSVAINRMKQVIADTKAAAPASSYGLVLWSHANGWQNDSGTVDEPAENALSPLSFGADGTSFPKKMKLTSLARALEGQRFDFIYFDCCHMATVEVAYELRNLTPWIAGSPTELEVDGMPYYANIPAFFASTPNLKQAIANTYNYFTPSGYNGCCISLIATAGLDNLARVSREALALSPPPNYSPVRYFRTAVMDSGIYDMYHYFNALTASDPELQARWTEAFSNVVAATHTTPRVYGLDASDFHGLGCNIVTDVNTLTKGDYQETAWARDVVIPENN